MGLFLGFIVGDQLWNLFISYYANNSPSWLYATLATSMIVFMILMKLFSRQFKILATSFGGAYLVIRMIGLMIGHYPNEVMIASEIEQGYHLD